MRPSRSPLRSCAWLDGVEPEQLAPAPRVLARALAHVARPAVVAAAFATGAAGALVAAVADGALAGALAAVGFADRRRVRAGVRRAERHAASVVAGGAGVACK